ncbi:glycosyl transferase [Azoarcus sp. DN11]|nr:glycosyl transferase [Azoarcus sp. DN11]
MVERLVESLLAFQDVRQIIVTCNVPEPLHLPVDARIAGIDNTVPAGFGANHNAAFAQCVQPYFCPLNPDVEFREDPFPLLLEMLRRRRAAVVAPLVKSPTGEIEDSIRRFPTLQSLFAKVLGGDDGRYHVADGQDEFFPAWVAGMFMLFRSEDYARLGGFDERFFLYYEDVDICARAWQRGMRVLACPRVAVIHDARRGSRRSAQHFGWHLASLLRYLRKYWRRWPKTLG